MQKILNNLKTLFLNFFSPREILLVISLVLVSVISFILLAYFTTNYFKIDRIVYRGSITEGIMGIPKITNPFLSIDQSEKDISALLYSPLIRNLSGNTFDLALASKVEMSSDKSTIKIYLEEDAKFSDGTSINSEDIVYSLQNIPIEKDFTVEVVDTKTIILNFKKNSEGNPLQTLTYPIISKKEKFEEAFSKNLITSSPLKIKSVTKDGEGNVTNIKLTRFNNGEEKLPYIKNFELDFYSDDSLALSALQRKELDILSSIPGQTISKIKEDSSIKLNTAELPNNFALFINQNKNEALQNLRFRQILSQSIDRTSLVNQVLGGFGIPQKNILNENDKSISSEELIKRLPSLLSLENGVLYMNNKTEDSDKKGEAKNKSEEKSPVKISITTINNKELTETAEFIANSWKKLGVEVEIKKIDRKELQTVVKDRDFDILLFGFSIKNNNDYYSFFSSKERNYPKLNISNYTNKKVDTYVENLQTETDAKNISELKNSLSKELENDMPLIMLYKPLYVQALASKHTVTLPKAVQNEEDRYRFYKEWYLHTEKVLKPFVNSNLIDKMDQTFN